MKKNIGSPYKVVKTYTSPLYFNLELQAEHIKKFRSLARIFSLTNITRARKETFKWILICMIGIDLKDNKNFSFLGIKILFCFTLF